MTWTFVERTTFHIQHFFRYWECVGVHFYAFKSCLFLDVTLSCHLTIVTSDIVQWNGSKAKATGGRGSGKKKRGN